MKPPSVNLRVDLAPATCDGCHGRGGRQIVSLMDGETWETCSQCYGRGTIDAREFDPIP